jgi:hypothetical protein
MSSVIIPLAGPDFFLEKYGIKPFYKTNENQNLIDYILDSRPWSEKNGDLFIFILKKDAPLIQEVIDHIKSRFSAPQFVFLSSFTKGSLFSALSGVSLINDIDCPVIIDLADIFFTLDLNVKDCFLNHSSIDCIVPYFHSTNNSFSYLQIINGFVIDAKEKEVISNNASAGVYIYRNAQIFLHAVLFAMNNPSVCSKNSIFYTCPTINHLKNKHQSILALAVRNAEPFSLVFH